jgi:hypothetical protein
VRTFLLLSISPSEIKTSGRSCAHEVAVGKCVEKKKELQFTRIRGQVEYGINSFEKTCVIIGNKFIKDRKECNTRAENIKNI